MPLPSNFWISRMSSFKLFFFLRIIEISPCVLSTSENISVSGLCCKGLLVLVTHYCLKLLTDFISIC